MSEKTTISEKRNFAILIVIVLAAGTAMLLWGQYNTASQIYDMAFEGYNINELLASDSDWTKNDSDAVEYNLLLNKAKIWRAGTNKRAETYKASGASEKYKKTEPIDIYYEFYDNLSEKTVIILHAYNENLDDAAVFAPFWYSQGFNVLLPQMRGHSETPAASALGVYEQYDLYDLIKHEALENAETLVVHGKGIGAAAALLISSNDELKNDSGISFIIADTVFSDMKELELYQIKRMFSLGDFMVGRLLDSIIKSKLGFNVKDISLAVFAADIEIPVIFLCGDENGFCAPEMTKAVYEACGNNNKSFIEIKGARHGMCYTVSKNTDNAYENAVIQLLKSY